jgi:hypothetical protein
MLSSLTEKKTPGQEAWEGPGRSRRIPEGFGGQVELQHGAGELQWRKRGQERHLLGGQGMILRGYPKRVECIE